MKRKGERSIPDFAGKKKGISAPDPIRLKGLPRAPRDAVVKPQATSVKSGRRGQ